MIVEEANKVVQWEQTMELARREAMQHAADSHGQGATFAAGTQHERNELVESMMLQKVNITLLGTVRVESCFGKLLGCLIWVVWFSLTNAVRLSFLYL